MDLPNRPVPRHVGNGGDAWDGDAIWACTFLAHRHNVGGDDGWHDAAYGVANDFVVHRGAKAARRETGINEHGICCGVSADLGWIRPGGCGAPNRTEKSRFTVAVADFPKYKSSRNDVLTGRCLRILAAQEPLPDAVQQSYRIYYCPLVPGLRRRVSHGAIAWSLLRRLLRGIDAAAVYGRRDEPNLGRRAFLDCTLSESFTVSTRGHDDGWSSFGGCRSRSDCSLKLINWWKFAADLCAARDFARRLRLIGSGQSRPPMCDIGSNLAAAAMRPHLVKFLPRYRTPSSACQPTTERQNRVDLRGDHPGE